MVANSANTDFREKGELRMNKVIHSVLLSVLTISAAQAQLHSNRTYLRARDTHSNNEMMNMFGRACRAHGAKGGFGSTLSVSGFYRDSHNKSDMAKYFGGGQSDLGNQDGTIVAENKALTHANRHNYLDGYQIEHEATPVGTATLAPRRNEAGAHINWHHDLSKVMKNLSLSVNVPIVQVETTMGATFSGTNAANLATYFAGGYSVATGSSNSQDALGYARLDATKRKKTEVADVVVDLGYAIKNDKASKMHVAISATIPTSKKVDGVWAFQPQVGAGKHFGLGAKAFWQTRIWYTNPCTQGLDLMASASYRYLFAAEQVRTMGLYNHWYERISTAGHYRNLAKADGLVALPAANALTRNMDVTPGSEFNGCVGLKYHYKNFNLFAGYNLHARDKEGVTLKKSNDWFNGEYGMPAEAHDLTTAVAVGSAHTYGGLIQREGVKTGATDSAGTAVATDNAAEYYISTAACASPSDVTHKVGGVAEMQFPKCRFPFSISGGGEYEFNDRVNNRGVHSWAAWGKLSFCF